MIPVLQVEQLTKQFKSGFWPFNRTCYTAVDTISFQLLKGEILGFLGPNGAGKTTTIQMLLGTLNPTSGKISYFGSDFEHNRITVLQKVGYASGFDKLPARLTIQENLDIVGRIYQMPHRQRVEKARELLTLFGIWNIRDRHCGSLSAGQSTRVILAKAFMSNPDIVLLDEPTAALDPDVAQEVRSFIINQSNHYGTSVLITSHNMDEVTELCDRVLVLKQGTIIADNSPELLANSISNVRLHLAITSNLDKAINYLGDRGVHFTSENNTLIIDVDEHQIAELLIAFGQHNIRYSHISIDKPTLEDYFISIAK